MAKLGRAVQQKKLSTPERSQLFSVVSNLPISQFLHLEFALCVPDGCMPGLASPQSIRAASLFKWLEQNHEPGLALLLECLEDMGVYPFKQDQETISTEKNNSTKNLRLVLKGDFDELNRDRLKAILVEIQQLAQDFSIEITQIKNGSIKIDLEGSLEALKRLQEILDSGEVTEISGFLVDSVDFLDNTTHKQVNRAETFHKASGSASTSSRIVNSLDPIPNDSSQAILCCYINATSKIQVARITNIHDWYFERVVFPGQRLLFKALPQALLEIHTGMMASTILSDSIPCSRLMVDQPENLDASSSIPTSPIADTVILPGNIGTVQYEGRIWPARCRLMVTINPGDKVDVIGEENGVLIVLPFEYKTQNNSNLVSV